MVRADGTPWTGYSSSAGNYVFLPRLRFDAAAGYHWDGGLGQVATGSASGFYAAPFQTSPLTISVTATITGP